MKLNYIDFVLQLLEKYKNGIFILSPEITTTTTMKRNISIWMYTIINMMSNILRRRKNKCCYLLHINSKWISLESFLFFVSFARAWRVWMNTLKISNVHLEKSSLVWEQQTVLLWSQREIEINQNTYHWHWTLLQCFNTIQNTVTFYIVICCKWPEN